MSRGQEVGGAGPQPVEVGGEVTLSQLEADEWARQAVSERLPRVRAVATAWGATVTAITGIFGLATLTGSDKVVTDLSSTAAVFFGLTAAFAALAAAASVLFASLAAQQNKQNIPADISERESLYTETFNTAVNRLQSSRILAGVAVLLLMVNFAIRWYAP